VQKFERLESGRDTPIRSTKLQKIFKNLKKLGFKFDMRIVLMFQYQTLQLHRMKSRSDCRSAKIASPVACSTRL